MALNLMPLLSHHTDCPSRLRGWNMRKLCCCCCCSVASVVSDCDPIDGSPPSSPVHGLLQARTLEWVATFFSNAGKWKVKIESEDAQLYPTLSDPMDCSPSGSSVHGIFQARVLEWVAIAWHAEKIKQTVASFDGCQRHWWQGN